MKFKIRLNNRNDKEFWHEIQNIETEIKFHTKPAAAKSCRELSDHGFKTSGHFRIDPDSRYFGTLSFEVYCDFENKSTLCSIKMNLDFQMTCKKKSSHCKGNLIN